jgi:DNA replicative helicase MCM subunit Mcm2 (Cdc46/Mcm family)
MRPPRSARQVIPQDLLRKYIVYAREKVRPKLYELDSEKLSRLFADLRRESVATGSFPITVRHLESMIRMAEASARMSLREYVRADDIDLAISVAVESFVNAQKMSIKKTLQRVRAPSPIQDHLFARKVTQSFINLPFPIGLPQVSHTGARS